MAKKKLYIASIVLLTIIIALICTKQNTHQKVQEYVATVYSENNSLIHAYPYKTDSQFLSESVGLYMNYLLLINDSLGFEQQVKNLNEHFIVKIKDDVFIRWTLDEKTSANSLIDDVRIINGLNKGAEQFDKPEYKNLATLLTTTLKNKQMKDSIYTDYIEWTFDQTAPRTTLSYLTTDFFETLDNNDKTKDILLNLDNNMIFFPEYYDIVESNYKYAKDVHMIDQLLIAINRQELNVASPAFRNWITTEWKNNKKIAGQYTRNTLTPSVNYESISVYAYLAKYFQLTNQKKLAIDVKKHTESLANQGSLEDAHFFDYILYKNMIKSD